MKPLSLPCFGNFQAGGARMVRLLDAGTCLLGCLCALAVFVALAAAHTAQAATESVIYSFPARTHGWAPEAGLINVAGSLYSTTINGGTYGYGIIFSVNESTGAEAVLHSFQDNGADGDGNSGIVFSLDLSTGTEAVVYAFQDNGMDAGGPMAGLINVHGVLYGTTYLGGVNNGGAVFSIDPSKGVESVLHSFCGQRQCSDGQSPAAALVNVHGTLYGTTSYGGNKGDGTVFALDPETGAESVIYSFCSQGGDGCTDGAVPLASLIYEKGILYGTTQTGGTHNYCRFQVGCGSVFSLDPDTGEETVIYDFQASGSGDGNNPDSGLIDVHGTLYGTVPYGGADGSGCGGSGCGAVFAVDPKTGSEKVIHSFGRGKDGADPEAGLILVNGELYGTTASGGRHGCGTVFSVTP
jgi:uncharacterized repeat protein (TIGR03803 family)